MYWWIQKTITRSRAQILPCGLIVNLKMLRVSCRIWGTKTRIFMLNCVPSMIREFLRIRSWQWRRISLLSQSGTQGGSNRQWTKSRLIWRTKWTQDRVSRSSKNRLICKSKLWNKSWTPQKRRNWLCSSIYRSSKASTLKLRTASRVWLTTSNRREMTSRIWFRRKLPMVTTRGSCRKSKAPRDSTWRRIWSSCPNAVFKLTYTSPSKSRCRILTLRTHRPSIVRTMLLRTSCNPWCSTSTLSIPTRF